MSAAAFIPINGFCFNLWKPKSYGFIDETHLHFPHRTFCNVHTWIIVANSNIHWNISIGSQLHG